MKTKRMFLATAVSCCAMLLLVIAPLIIRAYRPVTPSAEVIITCSCWAAATMVLVFIVIATIASVRDGKQKGENNGKAKE